MAPQDDPPIDFAVHSSCLSSQFRSPNKSFCFDLCYGPMASVHFPNDTHASCVGFVLSFVDMLCHSVIVDVSVLWFGARVPCWWSVHIFLYLSLWLGLDDGTTSSLLPVFGRMHRTKCYFYQHYFTPREVRNRAIKTVWSGRS